MASTPERLILASASTARAAMLRAAGVEFTVEPASIDEDSLKRQARAAGDSPLACAAALAAAKAHCVSERHPRALVIGADQILASEAEWLDKPGDLAEAGTQLRQLRGQTHILATAACVVRDGIGLWRGESAPEMMMRQVSDPFIKEYIAAEGEILLGSVGAYRLEGRGVQLFSRIDGDYFAVLGLPLLELLEFLRRQRVLAA